MGVADDDGAEELCPDTTGIIIPPPLRVSGREARFNQLKNATFNIIFGRQLDPRLHR
ncbi:hypothetical protein [Maricaulis sp.]|uniref:hypothetical protein n=1 Tax=Maricaulis sp. TaxID=1486257 RepID=UPI002604DAFF|nr:hypothetical protein [Maricaulis sp.]